MLCSFLKGVGGSINVMEKKNLQQSKIGVEGRCHWINKKPRICGQLLFKLEARRKGTVEPKGIGYSI